MALEGLRALAPSQVLSGRWGCSALTPDPEWHSFLFLCCPPGPGHSALTLFTVAQRGAQGTFEGGGGEASVAVAVATTLRQKVEEEGRKRR